MYAFFDIMKVTSHKTDMAHTKNRMMVINSVVNFIYKLAIIFVLFFDVRYFCKHIWRYYYFIILQPDVHLLNNMREVEIRKWKEKVKKKRKKEVRV